MLAFLVLRHHITYFKIVGRNVSMFRVACFFTVYCDLLSNGLYIICNYVQRSDVTGNYFEWRLGENKVI